MPGHEPGPRRTEEVYGVLCCAALYGDQVTQIQDGRTNHTARLLRWLHMPRCPVRSVRRDNCCCCCCLLRCRCSTPLDSKKLRARRQSREKWREKEESCPSCQVSTRKKGSVKTLTVQAADDANAERAEKVVLQLRGSLKNSLALKAADVH